jgi:hypothetical protein
MNKNENLYIAESDKCVHQFVADFSLVVKANRFVINNHETMNMRETFHRHGGEVPGEFDLHMVQVCKPTKADKSLTANPERSILMPKFIHVFSKNAKTQIRYMRYSPEQISAMVPDDPHFPESLAQTFEKICSMIEEAKSAPSELTCHQCRTAKSSSLTHEEK